MPAREYNQACAIAASLDLLGQRWTLLIVRDLLISPRRYTDLLAALPGIGTNLLAERLKSMTELGIVEQAILPEPAASRVYQLTEKGSALERPLVELCRWGLRHGVAAGGETFHDPRWTVLAMRAAFVPERARRLSAGCEFRVDDTVFYARVEGGQLETGLGPLFAPELVLALDDRAFRDLASGAVALEVLLADGRASLTGDLDLYRKFASAFDPPEAPATQDHSSVTAS